MERKAFTSLTEASMRVLLGETHMIGKTVIVKGKKGKVIKQVGSDGKTESDEIYTVKFEDGVVEDIPARDMEMQGNINNRKEPSENELEDIVNESVELDEVLVQLDEVLSDREMDRFNKAHTALHTRYHKQALQIIKFIDSVEKHKQKWVDSFGDYVTAKLPKQLKLSNPNSVEYQQGRGRGDWSFLIQHGNVRYNNRDMPWMPKSGELTFDKFMKLLDTWKKNANKPKSTGSHMGRFTESVELDEGAKISRNPQLKIGFGKGRPAGAVGPWHTMNVKASKSAYKKLIEVISSLESFVESDYKFKTGILTLYFNKKKHTSAEHKKALEFIKSAKGATSVTESVEHLDEKRNKTDIPADKETKDWIQSGRAKILMSTDSTLGGNSKFVIVNNFKGGGDKVLMAIISDPARGRIKMFSYHGSHVNVKGAMKFAKNNKLVTGWIHSESVEIDESKMSEIDARRQEGETPQQIAKGMNVNVSDINSIPHKGSSIAPDIKKKIRAMQDETARAYVRQKQELNPGPKTANYNKLADRLDALRKQHNNNN